MKAVKDEPSTLAQRISLAEFGLVAPISKADCSRLLSYLVEHKTRTSVDRRADFVRNLQFEWSAKKVTHTKFPGSAGVITGLVCGIDVIADPLALGAEEASHFQASVTWITDSCQHVVEQVTLDELRLIPD